MHYYAMEIFILNPVYKQWKILRWSFTFSCKYLHVARLTDGHAHIISEILRGRFLFESCPRQFSFSFEKVRCWFWDRENLLLTVVRKTWLIRKYCLENIRQIIGRLQWNVNDARTAAGCPSLHRGNHRCSQCDLCLKPFIIGQPY